MTSSHDVELLSAYLDGRLSPSDSKRLESRLSSEAGLRAVINDLRETRALLRQLPQRRAPRNFTLTPSMAGLKPPAPRAYPILRFATALTAVLFIATFAINGFASVATFNSAAAPAPAAGGVESVSATQQTPVASEAPPRPLAAIGPTQKAAPLANQSVAPTESPYSKSAAQPSGDGAPARVRNEAPVTFAWQMALGLIVILLGSAAWLMRRAGERKFRKQWK